MGALEGGERLQSESESEGSQPPSPPSAAAGEPLRVPTQRGHAEGCTGAIQRVASGETRPC